MSTIKVSKIQHPSAAEPSIELSSDGTVLLPLSGIGDLADVDEGSGAADGDVLTYDGVGNVWVPESIVLPAGVGSNVVQTVKTDTFTNTSTSYTPVTGLAVTITPSTNTSRILLFCSFAIAGTEANLAGAHIRFYGGNAGTAIGDAASSRERALTNTVNAGGTSYFLYNNAFVSTVHYMDSPATTSPVTYGIEIRNTTTFNSYIGRSQLDSDNAAHARVPSIITAIEVAS